MTKREPDPIRIQLTLGILGFLGVLLTVLATIFGPIIQENIRQRNLPSQTPIVIVATATQAPVIPTDTVPAGDPTSTPAPATNTPEPTFTFTAIPPVDLGQDWSAGCISSSWKPYPASIPVSEKDGCLQEPVQAFSADGGSLSFLYSRNGTGGEEVYGLFAPLPESGSVTVFIRLKDLTNVDLWTGVFAEADINSQGILMTIPAGNVNNRLIVQKEVPSYDNMQKTQMINQGDGFIMTFEFNPVSVRALVNRNLFVTNPEPISSAKKWLFIGYKGLAGTYRIEGNFFNFELK
jgi:hypothetical protein